MKKSLFVLLSVAALVNVSANAMSFMQEEEQEEAVAVAEKKKKTFCPSQNCDEEEAQETEAQEMVQA